MRMPRALYYDHNTRRVHMMASEKSHRVDDPKTNIGRHIFVVSITFEKSILGRTPNSWRVEASRPDAERLS